MIAGRWRRGRAGNRARAHQAGHHPALRGTPPDWPTGAGRRLHLEGGMRWSRPPSAAAVHPVGNRRPVLLGGSALAQLRQAFVLADGGRSGHPFRGRRRRETVGIEAAVGDLSWPLAPSRSAPAPRVSQREEVGRPQSGVGAATGAAGTSATSRVPAAMASSG